MATKFWLLKAEPDSRMVSGKDVKFSVDDFEAAKTTPWEGVRNPEARNLLKEMRVGQKALFYHSNCKNPGIAAFAEVSKEAYPDHTAWDPSHPYFDKKTDPAAAQATPKWFMCDLTFTSRAKHFVPLALLKYLATLPAPPKELEYISEDGLRALKIMDLIGRGRLSVQRVDQAAFDAITLLAENGGWDDLPYTIGTKRPVKVVSYNEDDVDEEEEEPPKSARKAKAKAKPKA
ncbi:EVE domain-containing protein, partial [Mycena floridula]